jgi:MoxR-like ATPase
MSDDVKLAEAFRDAYQRLKTETGKVIVGQDHVVEGVLNAIFCNGHALLVGVPGLAKTLLVKTVSQALHLSFNRIQFTPDLMPGDITGTEILDGERNFRFERGPVFANIVLADEINRTSPKTQAALLEAMQERNVTVAGKMHHLPRPFFVLATQNPIEQEGTYPLPEAQLDRFMFNINLGYPTFEQELDVIRNTTSDRHVEVSPVLHEREIVEYQQLVRRVPITDHVLEYAVKLVSSTRPGTALAHPQVKEWLSFGAGPRAGQYLVLGAKCHALVSGKFAPDIEDIKAVAADVLRHRIVRNYRAEAEGVSADEIVSRLL